jgi:hypothetical protein
MGFIDDAKKNLDHASKDAKDKARVTVDFVKDKADDVAVKAKSSSKDTARKIQQKMNTR